MNTTKLVTLSTLGLITASTAAAATNKIKATKLAKKPNIVFLFSDDHAVQAIGAYGSVLNKTPNIDRIAKEGVIFKNSFCAN